MTDKQYNEFQKLKVQAELEVMEKLVSWWKNQNRKTKKDEVTPTAYKTHTSPKTNNNKEIKEIQTGVIESVEKNIKQLKFHFLLDNGEQQTQCYQFTKGGIFYLLNNFLEPMGVTELETDSPIKDFINFNYSYFTGAQVEIKRHKDNENDKYWKLDKCLPNNFLDWNAEIDN